MIYYSGARIIYSSKAHIKSFQNEHSEQLFFNNIYEKIMKIMAQFNAY